VLKHVNQVIEQLATVATYQDVRVAVCLEVAKLQGNGFWDVALRLLGRTELLALRGSLSRGLGEGGSNRRGSEACCRQRWRRMKKRRLDRLGVVAEQTLPLQLGLKCMVAGEEQWLACWLLLTAVEAFEHVPLDALKGRRVPHHKFVAALVAHLSSSSSRSVF